MDIPKPATKPYWKRFIKRFGFVVGAMIAVLGGYAGVCWCLIHQPWLLVIIFLLVVAAGITEATLDN